MKPNALPVRGPVLLCLAVGAALIASVSACAPSSQARLGMVTDEKSGLMYGSAIQDNLVTDASFYTNRKIKVRTRNTSGDKAFGLGRFTDDLNTAYAGKGYQPTQDEDFGLIMDINIMHSGHIQTTQAANYALVGALLGQTYGGQTQRGVITGTVTGAALGSILGEHVTEDTYMIVAQVTFGVLKPYKTSQKRVTFSRSEKLANIDDPNEEEKVMARGFKKTFTTQIAVYAGGRNVAQSAIAEEVRKRAVRIVADFI